MNLNYPGPYPKRKSPPKPIATSGVYRPTRVSTLLHTRPVAPAVVAAVLDDVTGGWGVGASLLFRRRVGRGHERPFHSETTATPPPVHSHNAADSRQEETTEKTRIRKTGCLFCELCGRYYGCTKTRPNNTHCSQIKPLTQQRRRIFRGFTAMKPATTGKPLKKDEYEEAKI